LHFLYVRYITTASIYTNDMVGEEPTKKSKSRTGGITEGNGVGNTFNMQNIQIPVEARDELTALLQELLLKTHELSFEYSTLDYEHLTNCPLAAKAQELFKVVKRLNEIVRRTVPVTPPNYTR